MSEKALSITYDITIYLYFPLSARYQCTHTCIILSRQIVWYDRQLTPDLPM